MKEGSSSFFVAPRQRTPLPPPSSKDDTGFQGRPTDRLHSPIRRAARDEWQSTKSSGLARTFCTPGAHARVCGLKGCRQFTRQSKQASANSLERHLSLLPGPGVQFIFQQAALDFCVKENASTLGAQANLFGKIGITRKDVTCLSSTGLFEKVTDIFVN